MLRRADVNHVLRAAAAVTRRNRFVVVGTGAVIATTSKPLPAAMMLTNELDLYADGADNVDEVSDLIDATIGEGSMFHRTFRYYGHGVGERTALMPLDWRSRAKDYRGAGDEILVICPDAHDIAVSKLCAWREKDRDWLRSALQTGILSVDELQELLNREMPAAAPTAAELRGRLDQIASKRP